MEYLAIYPETIALVKRYSEAQRCLLYEAMATYAYDSTEPEWEADDIKWFVWEALKQQVDRARAKSSQNRTNATMKKQKEANVSEVERIVANASEPKQTEANLPKEKENNKETDIKENNLTIVKEKRRFSPPTVEEVSEYCKERKNSVDPQRFVDFYASKGWRVGNQPMKDWHAAVRTWEQRDKSPSQPVRQVTAQQYTQRAYTEEELEDRSAMDDLLMEALGVAT